MKPIPPITFKVDGSPQGGFMLSAYVAEETLQDYHTHVLEAALAGAADTIAAQIVEKHGETMLSRVKPETLDTLIKARLLREVCK